MLAVKSNNAAIARILLEFGIDPSVLLLKDADGSTPLHVAVQNTNTALAEVLLKHGPTKLLYTENWVGQTPLDIASLKCLPQMTGSMEVSTAVMLSMDAECHLRISQKSPPFNVEKQRIEIPKLRATLDALIADGLLAEGTKLTTELLAFAGRMEGRLVVETTRKNVAEKRAKEDKDELGPSATARTYFALCDVAAARPGTRQLVHLADVQRSVRRNLAQQDGAPRVRWSKLLQVINDPEMQHIAELKTQSLFSWCIYNYGERVYLYGEDKF
ncbi:hypothetical protein H4582DRAFT_950578 [Lactarius indigo]|nr:hypothetical protein H4582DRAFT_950578 [Lactarius indigo]